MSGIHVARTGKGPEVVFVHGGASPATTWRGLEGLRERFTLCVVSRRGFAPSPIDRQDFERDARDLLPLLASRPHVVAHSYGGLGATLAACERPADVRSLTLIEVPLWGVAGDDPDVDRIRRLGDTVMRDGLDTDPGRLRAFLTLAGTPGVDDGPLPEPAERAIRRAHHARATGDADPPLAVLRDADVPILVASGDHTPALERVGDALAAELGAERAVHPGAGHFVPAAPGFADRLGHFLDGAAGRRPADGRAA